MPVIEFHTAWRKSSHSADSNCVELAHGWRKSSHSANDSNCVELAHDGAVIGIRDSKAPTAGHLTLPAPAVETFLTTLRAG